MHSLECTHGDQRASVVQGESKHESTMRGICHVTHYVGVRWEFQIHALEGMFGLVVFSPHPPVKLETGASGLLLVVLQTVSTHTGNPEVGLEADVASEVSDSCLLPQIRPSSDENMNKIT